jgi:rhodanese-related sulfurtransferase
MFFSKNKKYESIDLNSAKEMIKTSKALVLDVRTSGEYRSGKIKGAINIPLNELVARAPKELKELDKEIIVYCLSGSRSKLGSKILSKLGYTSVYDFGPISKWDGK